MAEAKIELVNHEATLSYWSPNEWPFSAVITGVAKVCTAKAENVKPREVEKNKAFVQKLMKRGHWTPSEFVDLTFYLTTSRAVANELVRHRMASYMQLSQRYVRYDEALPVVMPATIKGTLEADLWKAQMRDSHDVYLYLLEHGQKPEDARTVLPLATATRMLCKMNLREFRHFLDLRTDKPAWREMRILANLMAEAFAKQFPDEVFLISDVWHREGE